MKKFFPLLGLLLFFSCDSQNGTISGDGESEWLIPRNEIFDGGPGKDGIPSIDNPKFVSAEEVEILEDQDLVIIVEYDGTYKAYPHPILDWHEIVNDQMLDFHYALTYCPLTGTGINWNRNLSGTPTTFGVSGLLYNSNLIPYDRETDSNWSQMRLECVNGEMAGSEAEVFSVYEGTWASVKEIEGIQVLSTETGFSRDYNFYPYGDYRTNNSNIIFPVSNSDTRRQAKARCLGLFIDNQTKVYGFDDFDSEGLAMLLDEVENRELLIIADSTRRFISAFYVSSGKQYEVIADQFPIILKDNQGNLYDVFGNSSNGGEELAQPKQFMGYWFSWAAFYPELSLYGN